MLSAPDLCRARREVKRLGGRIITEFPFISSIGAEIPTYACHNYIEKDVSVSAAGQVSVLDTAVSPPAVPFDASEWHRAGITGRGIGVAVIDTGIYPHLDFCVPRLRISAFVDFTSDRRHPYDDNGHGTAVAGIACGSGLFSRVSGMAPQADVVALKAVDKDGAGNVIGILTAMQWLYAHFRALRVRVVNLSLGSDPTERDPLVMGVEALTAAGLTVVASAGNGGPARESLKSPGIARSAITTGGAQWREKSGWGAADFSSRGAENSGKPDLIAPAVEIPAAKAGGGYFRMSGTSAAAPIVSGMCALLLQERPTRTPLRVKSDILAMLRPLDCPHTACGAGVFLPYSR